MRANPPHGEGLIDLEVGDMLTIQQGTRTLTGRVKALHPVRGLVYAEVLAPGGIRFFRQHVCGAWKRLGEVVLGVRK